MRNRAPGEHVSPPMHGLNRPRRALASLTLLALLVGACAPQGASPGTGGTPTPGPTTLTAAELRLLLIERLGPRWYCDPDEYPVSQGSEQERAIERWPELLAEPELPRAIGKRLAIDIEKASDTDKLAIYRQWKVAVSIPLDPLGNGRYRFDYTAQPAGGALEGRRTTGIVDDRGTMTIEQEGSVGEPMCPICLSRGTLIDTPDGPIPVERLGLGDPIWTLDEAGRRVLGTVIALGSTPAPADHHVVRLRLANGNSVTASPGHPLADGRLLDAIGIGDAVGGSRVIAADLIPYGGDQTFDLVASGATGAYFAGGIALGTTLR